MEEGSIKDMKKIYKEYLAEEEALNKQVNITQSIISLLKYMGIRLAISSSAYPFESSIILRQVQYGSSSSSNEPSIDKTLSTMSSPTIEDQIEAYEKYLLRPPQSLQPFLRDDVDSDIIGAKDAIDSLGYVTKTTLLDPRGLQLTVDTKLPLLLDKNLSIFSSMSLIIKRHGFFSLWQGLSAHYLYSLSSDTMKNLSSEIFLSTSFGGNFVTRHGFNSLYSISLFSIIDSISSFIPIPLEVAKIQLLTQSFLFGEKKLDGVIDCIKSNYQSKGLNGAYPNAILAFSSKLINEFGKVFPSFVLECFVSRYQLDVSSILMQALLISFEALLLNSSLLITLPLETVRYRLIASDIPSKPRIPTRPYTSVWNCFFTTLKEEGWSALYQGVGLKFLSNTSGLLSNWLLHLNGELLEGKGEENF